jgi:Enterochelin esterase and related enzymes
MRRRIKRFGAAWAAASLLSALLINIQTGDYAGAAAAQVEIKEASMSERITAQFGSPVIDGKVDPVWNKAQAFQARHRSGATNASAVFRAMWDDHALYILAKVKDSHLSVQSGTPYMQDSIEIFLDEQNDKTQEYGADDLHFRVNVENVRSVDKGDASRFYTAVSKTEDGYVVEARIALRTKPGNGTVMGIELQVNDAVEAERVGTLNVFDATGMAWNDTGLFGEIVLAGKRNGDKSAVNPYDLLNLIRQALSLDFKLYKNPDVVRNAVLDIAADNLLGSPDVTQEYIDEQYAALQAAIGELEMTEEAANEKYFTPLPADYLAASDKPGTIETLAYEAENQEGGVDKKKLHVYLPHGYNAADRNTKYNVLYLMHGGGENEDLLFGGPGENRALKKILDNMIARGDIEPLIVVTPSFYGGKNDVALFHEELIGTILPLVETKYNTYAKSASAGDLKASRAHRAFGGFSMGSVTTWHLFAKGGLDYFKYYIPLSGDSWAVEERGGGTKPAETAEFLAQVARKSGYKPDEFYIFSATGTQDIAWPNLKPQTEAMKRHDDVFRYSSNPAKGNFYFMEAEGGSHTWYWQNQYIYNILPDLFRSES